MSEAAWRTDAANGQEDEVLLWVRFYKGALKNAAKTLEMGRPIFDEVPFVKVHIPGDKTVSIDRPAWIDDDEYNPNPNADNVRFARQWEAFQLGKNPDGASGTPLSEWSAMPRNVVEELASSKITTLEQLAGLTDSGAEKLMGSMAWRQKARDAVAISRNEAPVQKLRAELEAKGDEVEELRRLVKEQGERLDSMTKTKTKT